VEGSDPLLNQSLQLERIPQSELHRARFVGNDRRVEKRAPAVHNGVVEVDGGWKGKGLWAGSGTRAPFHQEGGKGTKPKLVKFQIRPDPLAK
jgi:hypothetical protein